MAIQDRIRELRRVRAGDLAPHALNPRRHPERQRRAVARILETIGYADALLAYETPEGLCLFDGHLRAGLDADTIVPVLVTDLTPAEATVMLRELDRLAYYADIDEDLLAQLTAAVDTHIADGLLDEAVRLDALLAYREGTGPRAEYAPLPPIIEEPEVKESNYTPEVAPARCAPGDLWQMGDQRLLCGDASDPTVVLKLTGPAAIDLVFCSPPYYQQRSYVSGLPVWLPLMQGVFGAVAGACGPQAQLLVNLGLVHQEGEWVPYWDPWLAWMRTEGWRRFGWYVWDKGSGMPGDTRGRLASSHEFLFHLNRAGQPVPPARKTVPCVMAGQRVTGVAGQRETDGTVRKWTHVGAPYQPYKVPDSVVRALPALSVGFTHPAMFSIAFAAQVIAAFSDAGQRVLDPFLGSGTTLLACEQLGRRGFGIEVEPTYCDIALERWARLTNRQPERLTFVGKSDSD